MGGCCDHRVRPADEDRHRHATENLAQADALLSGRAAYEMMETGGGGRRVRGRIGWNAELVRGDLRQAIEQLKQEPGQGLFGGGVKLLQALAESGLSDEYEFVVHP